MMSIPTFVSYGLFVSHLTISLSVYCHSATETLCFHRQSSSVTPYFTRFWAVINCFSSSSQRPSNYFYPHRTYSYQSFTDHRRYIASKVGSCYSQRFYVFVPTVLVGLMSSPDISCMILCPIGTVFEVIIVMRCNVGYDLFIAVSSRSLSTHREAQPKSPSLSIRSLS